MRLCPLCKEILQSSILHQTEIDYCPKCLGAFFEKDELQAAKDIADPNIQWKDIDLWKNEADFKVCRGIRVCPVCRVPLYEVRYGRSDIIVDVCGICHGIWLDRAEFKKIMEYLRGEAGVEILQNYTKTLFKQFWDIFAGPQDFKDELGDFVTVLKLLNYRFIVKHPNLARFALNVQSNKMRGHGGHHPMN